MNELLTRGREVQLSELDPGVVQDDPRRRDRSVGEGYRPKHGPSNLDEHVPTSQVSRVFAPPLAVLGLRKVLMVTGMV